MYKTGDVILYVKTDVLGLFVRAGYFLRHLIFTDFKAIRCTHTANFLNDSEIVEAVTPRVQLVKFSYPKTSCEVWRRKIVSCETIKNYLISEINKPYSWYTYFFLIVLGIFRLEWLLNGIGKKGLICSELTAKAHIKDKYNWNCLTRIFLGFKAGKKSPDLMTPYDIAKEIYSNPDKWERIS